MSNAALASGLLLAVLAMALGFQPGRTAIPGALSAGTIAIIAGLALPRLSSDIAVAGCLASLVVAALAVFWPALVRDRRFVVLLFSAMVGLWAGLALGVEKAPRMWALLLSTLFLCVPAKLFIKRGWALAVRIVTSWLLAVALLAGSIPYLIHHPGYVPDHRM